MATVQLSKIQLRRGQHQDLPGAPITLMPLAFAPSLDDGELGFTTDHGRLFIGVADPTGLACYQRTDYPYQNIEVVTENSPVLVDNRVFFTSLPLEITASFLTLQTLDGDFNVDIAGNANAMIQYFVFASNGDPTRQGELNVIYNTNLMDPHCVDTAVYASGAASDLEWTATLAGPNVVLQYINQTGDTPTVCFRIDRPVVG